MGRSGLEAAYVRLAYWTQAIRCFLFMATKQIHQRSEPCCVNTAGGHWGNGEGIPSWGRLTTVILLAHYSRSSPSMMWAWLSGAHLKSSFISAFCGSARMSAGLIG